MQATATSDLGKGIHVSNNPGALSPRPAQERDAADQLALDRPAVARRVGLHLPHHLPFDSWRRLGRQIFVIGDASAWWLGDWLVYGQSEYADRYRKAIVGTSLDYQTLRNYAWVARRIPYSRRRPNLSFQHHAEIASLQPQQQDLWLDRAEASSWSRNELRRRVHAASPAVRSGHPLIPVMLRVNVPPEQEQRWHKAAAQANQDLGEWIVLILNRACAEALDDPDDSHECDLADSERAGQFAITADLRP
jgi:hypothetical protein